MPVNIQHRILNAELAPPQEAWQVIAARLDEEYNPVEITISERLADASLAPPATAWSRIAADLSRPEQYEQPAPQAKVISMVRRRLAVAATIAALLIAGIVLYFQFNRIDNGDTVVTTTGDNEPEATNAQGVDDSFMPDMGAAVSGLIPRRTRVRPSSLLVQTVSIPPAADPQARAVEVVPEPELPTVAVKPSSLIDEEQKIAVAAPPIRDAKGKLVLNLDLLTSETANYVTVTSPGGEQTRISSKFVNVLAYLNNDPDTKEQYVDFLFRQSSVWKKKFEEWRQRILASPTFSPTSSAFFDILDLRELVKD